MKHQLAALEADERSYVYSLIGVASALLGYAMYRIGDMALLARDMLFFLAVASAAVFRHLGGLSCVEQPVGNRGVDDLVERD